MPEISGHTQVFGILADPIHQVKTPQAFNALMARRGFDGVLVPFHVGAGNLASFVWALRHMRNLGGFIVTVPHKTAIVALCDAVTENARRIGAVNIVRREPDGRLVGEMKDGDGFVEGLRRAGIEPTGRTAFLAGAGGAANAIAFALVQAGVTRLTLINRTLAKADDLAARLLTAFPAAKVDVGSPDPTGYDLVINATSLGLKEDDPLPLAAERLAPAQTVAEIIMQPEMTALLKAAVARGCKVHPGKPMLTCQLDLMANFLGIPS